MWFCPEKYKKRDMVNVNEQMKLLTGELDDFRARITLVEFLRSNIGLTVEMLCGVKLAPYQEITLKGMLDKHRTMCVWGRGCSKSFIAAIFCFLQCIFEPKSKIIIAGPTFRTSRIIFSTYLEKIVKSEGAELLMQAFGGPPSKRNDLFEWEINGGNISAIPLNGEKIRGFRANVIVVDEYLLMPQDIIENVLKPFLSSPLDIEERIKIRELEDKLIEENLLTEDKRVQFENTSKFIALSSASFTFENLYETYKEWRKFIYDENKEDEEKLTYFISQIGFQALPPHMIDQKVAEEARNGGSSKASFLREHCAQFVDESDGYFSAKKMNDVTLPDGEDPSTLVSGRQGKSYVLAIDPSFSKSKTSDFFSMSVMELDDERKDGTLVHSYAAAGADLKKHIRYLDYLLTFFDIELVIIDNADFAFLDAANESALFKRNHRNLSFLDIDTELEGNDYIKMLQNARNKWDKKSGVMCFRQKPTVEYIRRSNQHLQACIDHKKVWFASSIRANPVAFERAINTRIPDEIFGDDVGNIGEFCSMQDIMIYNTKRECSLIEITTSLKGTQSFDLPRHLKQDNTEKRARKDNYTCLLLGNWAVKVYYEMKDVHPTNNGTFEPFFM